MVVNRDKPGYSRPRVGKQGQTDRFWGTYQKKKKKESDR